MFHGTLLIASSVYLLINAITAAPVADVDSHRHKNTACTLAKDPDCIQGFTSKHYFASFEKVKNGTTLNKLQGLKWSGFQTTTEYNGIIPSNCSYFGSDRGTKCHYAIASHARSHSESELPILRPAGKATSMKLTSFAWGAGPGSYYGPDETLQVLGYNKLASGRLQFAKSVESNFTTSDAGATGAPMLDVIMPPNFVFDAYRFNITTKGNAEPILLLDDVTIVTYTPDKS